MQPASQADILIWRSVLRSSRSREYIKPIKPPRHPVPYKMSSNYWLYFSLSLLFSSHSMKMYYTQTHTHTHKDTHTHIPQAAVPAATAPHTDFTKVLQVAGTSRARMCGGGWDCRSLQLSLWALSACAERTQPSSSGGTSSFEPVPALTDFSGTRLPGCFFPVEEAAWCWLAKDSDMPLCLWGLYYCHSQLYLSKGFVW